MREYILCSVMESPMMARRSPGWSSRPAGAGAFTGANLAKYASSGLDSSSAAGKLGAVNVEKRMVSRTRRWSFGNDIFMLIDFELQSEHPSSGESFRQCPHLSPERGLQPASLHQLHSMRKRHKCRAPQQDATVVLSLRTVSRQPHGPPEFCAERKVVGHATRRIGHDDRGVGSPCNQIRRGLDLIRHAGLALQLENEIPTGRGEGLRFGRGGREGEKRQ